MASRGERCGVESTRVDLSVEDFEESDDAL